MTSDDTEVPPSISINMYPGAEETYEYVLHNDSDITYGMTYNASVTSGAYSDLDIILEVGGDAPSLTESKGSERSVAIEVTIAPAETHNLAVTIAPSPEAESSPRTIKISFNRGEPS